VLVLGAGMVGSVIAADLALDLAGSGVFGGAGLEGAAVDPRFRVTVADAREESLAVAQRRTRGAATLVRADLSDVRDVARLAERADIVVTALPGWLGYRALEAVIAAGRPCCDIAFMPERALDLDGAAKARGVAVVTDCGVAPGMSNMLAALAARRLALESVKILVGGLPRRPVEPLRYKAPFSPIDVLEEYTRPARLKVDGKIVVRDALSEIERFESAELGTLEAFNTDGLRSLLETIDAPTLIEKTMRYPGHAALMEGMRAAGLLSTEWVEVRTAEGAMAKVRPLDVTARQLFPKWTYAPGEPDATVMRVEAVGVERGGDGRGGRRRRLVWDLYDEMDAATGFPSMSRVTAFPCTALVRLMADGVFKDRPGVHAPESIATEGIVAAILDYMAARTVVYRASIHDASGA
jgi:saccharopine dehydrogenase-like NADP-dependent oxidoreductase